MTKKDQAELMAKAETLLRITESIIDDRLEERDYDAARRFVKMLQGELEMLEALDLIAVERRMTQGDAAFRRVQDAEFGPKEKTALTVERQSGLDQETFVNPAVQD